MKKLNVVVSLLIAALLLLGQIGAAHAAPPAPTATPTSTAPITGTVKNITIKDATTANPYVEVEILLTDGSTQKVKLSIATALELGLIKDEAGTYVVDETKLDPTAPFEIEIKPEQILPDTGSTDEGGSKHPIGLILEMFFGDDLGVDYDAIMAYHEDGVGFGVLAQALWMTKNLEGDADLLAQIVEAKKSGDFSTITLPDGSTPKNWGQLRKAALSKGNNLGATKGNGKPEDKGNKDKGKGNNKP